MSLSYNFPYYCDPSPLRIERRAHGGRSDRGRHVGRQELVPRASPIVLMSSGE
jgi:hypothetical protein